MNCCNNKVVAKKYNYFSKAEHFKKRWYVSVNASEQSARRLYIYISLTFRRETDGPEIEKNKDRELEREGEKVWEPETERERETEMGNEKDRAVIIIAEFAFRMQTDQGHGAWGRYHIPHKHTHTNLHMHPYIPTHTQNIPQKASESVFSLR